MLMEPLIWRHDDTSRPPIDSLVLFSLWPENGIALAGKNDHVGARPVTVAFLISSNRKLGNMRTHSVLGEVELHVRAALAALAVIGELHVMGVRHEIGGQKKSPGQFALAAEITFGARIKPIEKSIVAVKNVIDIMKEVHHKAAIGDCKVARRLAAAGVEKLMISIDWNRKHAARPPLKSVLLAVALPDAGGAIALGDVDHFFVHVLLRFGFASRGNLTNVGIVGA